MKKKLVALTMSLALALSLAACGGKKEKADTAETEATTEVAEASEKEIKEAEPDVEEPEAEVSEETPEEEVVEEETAPTNEEIVRDFKENAEIGDFMIDENNILIAKIYNDNIKGRQFPSCESIMIDGKLYGIVDKINWSDDAFYIDDELGTDIFGTLCDIYEDSVPMYIRLEMTEEPDVMKVSVIFPEESTAKLSNYIATIDESLEDPQLYFGYAGQWLAIQGCWIPCEEFQDGKVTFTTNVSFEEGFPQNPEALTANAIGADDNDRVVVYRVFQEHVGGNGIGKSKEYTIIDD